MRLDHLLSKEEQVKNGFHCLVIKERQRDKGNIRNEKETESRRLYSFKNWITTAGGDALGGHTRSHPEHDG